MVVVTYKTVDKTPDLTHHGIKVQRWGVKNGPPYPLDYEDHSSSEKSKNPKSRISNYKNHNSRSGAAGSQEPTNRKRPDIDKDLLKKIGKGVLITAGVAALGAVAYSTISSGKFDSLIGAGKEYVDTVVRTSVDLTKLGKSIDQIDRKMVKSINSDLVKTKEGQMNCFSTSLSYCLNSLFGYDSKALGLTTVTEGGIVKLIDPVSGMKISGGPTVSLYTKLFDGLNVTQYSHQSLSSAFNSFSKGSTGVVRVFKGNMGHFINYECDSNGIVSIIDSQVGRVLSGDKYAMLASSDGWSISHAIDFSQATIREGINFKGLIK